MAPRPDRFSVKRQAALLGLIEGAQKQIIKLTRQYVFEKINYDVKNFVQLTDRDILTFAEAFVANHGSWLQQNRQPWRSTDGARVSEDREEDVVIINRLMQLQSKHQKQKPVDLKKASSDGSTGDPIALQTRSRRKRRRRQSCTSEELSDWSLPSFSSEEEDAISLAAWTDNNNHRKKRRYQSQEGLDEDDEPSRFHDQNNHNTTTNSENSTTNTNMEVGPDRRGWLTDHTWSGDPMKELYQSLGDAIPSKTIVHKTIHELPFKKADAAVQASIVSWNVSTQKDTATVCAISTQTESPAICTTSTQTHATTHCAASTQTISQSMTYSSIHTIAESEPEPVPDNPSDAGKELMVVEKDYYQALVFLALWQEKAEALTKERSQTVDRFEIIKLKKYIDSIDDVVKCMDHVAKGGEVLHRLREDKDGK